MRNDVLGAGQNGIALHVFRWLNNINDLLWRSSAVKKVMAQNSFDFATKLFSKINAATRNANAARKCRSGWHSPIIKTRSHGRAFLGCNEFETLSALELYRFFGRVSEANRRYRHFARAAATLAVDFDASAESPCSALFWLAKAVGNALDFVSGFVEIAHLATSISVVGGEKVVGADLTSKDIGRLLHPVAYA